MHVDWLIEPFRYSFMQNALVAVLIHVVALMLAPVIANGAPIRLPPILETAWLRNLVAIYVGYIILIALFFFMRMKLLKPDRGKMSAALSGGVHGHAGRHGVGVLR